MFLFLSPGYLYSESFYLVTFYIISQKLADSCCLVGFCQLMSSLELLAKRHKVEVSAFLEGGTTSVGNCFLIFQQNVVSLILWELITQ